MAEARGALKEWRREEEGRGRSSRAAPWLEMVALGDELRRSCSLAAAGNRGEAEEGHGRRRRRAAGVGRLDGVTEAGHGALLLSVCRSAGGGRWGDGIGRERERDDGARGNEEEEEMDQGEARVNSGARLGLRGRPGRERSGQRPGWALSLPHIL